MRALAVPAIICVLAACAPQPRSASYFAAHAAEAQRIAAACRSGDARGAECANAEAGLVAAANAARLATYRKAF